MEGHVARTEAVRNACSVSVRQPERNRQLGKSRLVREDNIKTAVK
jgi:hypothetical protein